MDIVKFDAGFFLLQISILVKKQEFKRKSSVE